MVKLKDAKCPNCGANIQVNDKLENTICQFCGSQVMIEEAIEKYKLEISGKVEVDGIRGRNSKIEQAKKHIKLEEYDTAKKILQEIIEEDSLDADAYTELIKVDIEELKSMDFNEESSDLTDHDSWYLFNEIINDYERVKKISEDDSIDKNLSKYKKELDHYFELKERVDKEEKELADYVEKLNDGFEKAKKISEETARAWWDAGIKGEFDTLDMYTTFCAHPYNGSYYNDNYRLTKINRITRDGIIEGRYYKTTREYSDNPLHENLHKVGTETLSFDEIKSKLDDILAITPDYLQKAKASTDKINKKNNNKIDRKNTILGAKNTVSQVRMYLDYAIIAIMVLITIGTLVTSGIGPAIAVGIFLDSWIIYLCVIKIGDHKDEISSNSRQKEINNLQKK